MLIVNPISETRGLWGIKGNNPLSLFELALIATIPPPTNAHNRGPRNRATKLVWRAAMTKEIIKTAGADNITPMPITAQRVDETSGLLVKKTATNAMDGMVNSKIHLSVLLLRSAEIILKP